MLLPKPHISWSQLDLWERKPEEYMRVYMLGFTPKDSVQMAYGRRIDRVLETGIAGSKLEEQILIFAKSYPERQVKMEATIKVDGEDVVIHGRFDGYEPPSAMWKNKAVIGDHKTGQIPWTQKRADDSGQLTFYDLIHWTKLGEQATLKIHWIPTMVAAGGVIATGEVIDFTTSRTLADILKMQARITKAVRGISARYEEVTSRVFN